MKYLVNLIALVILGFIIYGVIQFKDSDSFYELRQSTRQFTSKASEFIASRKQRMNMEMNPERKRPLTFIEKQQELQVFVPDVFDAFSDKDWDDFWNYIYEPVEDTSGTFATKKQRPKEEIEAYMRYRYPKPFAAFREDHWFYFWDIVLGPS